MHVWLGLILEGKQMVARVSRSSLFPCYYSELTNSETVTEIEDRSTAALVKILLAALGIALVFAAVSTTVLCGWWWWGTRREALPGAYYAAGVWGSSKLTLRADHTFVQDVQFMEYDEPEAWPYRQHPTKHEVIQGSWEDHGRDQHFPFERELVIKPLINLGPWQHGEVSSSFEGSFGPVMLSGLGIEVDAGADIVYRK